MNKIEIILDGWRSHITTEERYIVDIIGKKCSLDSRISKVKLKDNHSVVEVTNLLAPLYSKYILGSDFEYTEPYVYVQKEEGAQYTHFKVDLDGVFGLKWWNGQAQWKRLNAYKFFVNRILEFDKIDEFMEKLAQVKSLDSKVYHRYETLVEGYNDTSVESCMRGKGEYFEALEPFGNLVSFIHQGVIGRAILWNKEVIVNNEHNLDGVLDRIYPSSDHNFVQAVKQWAWENNYACKELQNYDDDASCDFLFKGDEVYLKLVIQLDSMPDYMPYMDTIKWFDRDSLTITNYDDRGSRCDSTEGICPCNVCCECCGDSYNEDDMYYTEDGWVCSDCYRADYCCTIDTDEYVRQEVAYYCQTDGEWYRSASDLISVGDYYYRYDDDDIFYCDGCNSYCHIDNYGAYIDSEGISVCDDCLHYNFHHNEETDEYERDE